MSCVDIPSPPIPTLPAPFTLPPLPAPPAISAGLCCQSVSLAIVPPPIPIGPLSPAIIVTINTAIKAFRDYVDQLKVECPRNS